MSQLYISTNLASEEYLNWYYNTEVWRKVTYLGIPCAKSVSDLWNYQEIITEIRPNVVLECGSFRGGSALYFSELQKSLSIRGQVLSVDIGHELVENQLWNNKNIEFFTSSSTAPVVLERVKELRNEFPGPMFVILDSDHSKGHVLGEMTLFREVIGEGDYLVVEDGCVNGHPVLPGWGEGPIEAVEEYFRIYPDDYIRDTEREHKFGFTFAPSGFLKPTRPSYHQGTSKVEPSAADMYLDLMVRCLVNTIYRDPPQDPWSDGEYNTAIRAEGRDWPSLAHSMIGEKRMNNLRWICEEVLKGNIAGDFIETGVWRGGACILMRAALKAYGCVNKTVWVADSFEGLPAPNSAEFPADKGDQHHSYDQLAISREVVEENFRRYDLLDNQVRFLQGWFKQTLPLAPIDKLAVVRLDGDMYESTLDAISVLYPKLSVGGYLIVDDYGAIDACRQAISDYRAEHGITEEIKPIDGIGVYWKREF